MKKITILVTLWSFSALLFAQAEEGPKVVKNVFSNSRLINHQTTEMLTKRSYNFSIQHRFGQTGLDESAYKEFLGIDLPANIRFGFTYAILNDLYIGLGRSKSGKTYDGEIKYRLLQQTKDNSMPVSVALYANCALSSADFPALPTNSFFADSITPFAYTFEHRLSYHYQVIVSKKFGNTLSLQLSPSLVYQNLVKEDRDNYTVALPFAGRVKTGLRSSIIFEYAYITNNRYEDHLDPVSLGMEFGTAGHTFQLIVTSANGLIDQHTLTELGHDYGDKKFALGFNITRTFWRKAKPNAHQN